MTRYEALRTAEKLLADIASAKLHPTSHAQLSEILKAKAMAAQGYIELAKELRLDA
jgi:hypothetical protein